MLLTILLLLFILVISYPIIGYKAFKAFRGKEKGKAFRYLVLLSVLILVPGFYIGILPGSDFFWKPVKMVEEKNFNLELTGIKFNFGDLIYEYETERFFNGDGYSIWIYKIDDEVAGYFEDPDEDFFIKYPATQFRKDWESKFWKRTPFDKKEQRFLDFASRSLDALEFELDDLLNEKGNYYAYEYLLHNYLEDETLVANIDFYIICPKRKLIVKINHNT